MKINEWQFLFLLRTLWLEPREVELHYIWKRRQAQQGQVTPAPRTGLEPRTLDLTHSTLPPTIGISAHMVPYMFLNCL